MAELKTKATDGDVDAFLATIADEQRREDAKAIRRLMATATRDPGTMWGQSIVGFGKVHLRYESGRELDWFAVGFSPRKQATTLYLVDGFAGYADLLASLGKHTTGKSCLYVKRLSDIDMDVLTELVARSVRHVGEMTSG